MSAITDIPQVRTLLLTDLVDSTALVERLGDTVAATLFRAHDRIVLELQQRWRGRLIDRSDGLLLIFERPIDGLGFASAGLAPPAVLAVGLNYAAHSSELGLKTDSAKQRPGVQVNKRKASSKFERYCRLA